MKALVWPVATYGCESWTLRKNEETRLDAFEMRGLRKILAYIRNQNTMLYLTYLIFLEP